jgi:hypothetical protein
VVESVPLPTPDIGALGQKVAFVPGTDLMHCSNERPYSMTSSASASDVGGTSRPSALALLRLITNSNGRLLDCELGDDLRAVTF